MADSKLWKWLWLANNPKDITVSGELSISVWNNLPHVFHTQHITGIIRFKLPQKNAAKQKPLCATVEAVLRYINITPVFPHKHVTAIVQPSWRDNAHLLRRISPTWRRRTAFTGSTACPLHTDEPWRYHFQFQAHIEGAHARLIPLL